MSIVFIFAGYNRPLYKAYFLLPLPKGRQESSAQVGNRRLRNPAKAGFAPGAGTSQPFPPGLFVKRTEQKGLF